MPVPLPVLAGVHRCALRWVESGTGQTAVNVIHIFDATPAFDPFVVFEAMDDAVSTNMWAPCVTTAVIQQVDITPLDGTSSTASFLTGGVAKWGGTDSGGFAPQQAALVKFGTGHRGRNNRGRIFLPFISTTSSADGHIGIVAAGLLTTAWGAFQTALQTDTPVLDHVVASYDRRHGGAGAGSRVITTYTGEDATGTQRKRQARNRGA